MGTPSEISNIDLPLGFITWFANVLELYQLVSGALGAACCHVIIGVSQSSSQTGGRAGGLSSLLPKVSLGLQWWVRCLVIAPCGAVFTPDLNF